MADLSHSHSPIEYAVENICGNLLKKSAEFWEDRNKAMLELTRLITKFEGASPATLHEMFNINVFRALIEPVKQMILDLRSQQVRDTCIFLTQLSKITGDLMRFFLRDTFESIFIAVKVPHKIMSGYVDECIISMLQHTTFKSAIPVIIDEYKKSKSKAAREKCLVYLNIMLTCWDLLDKEGDQIDEIIRLGLEDASMKGRELARETFINFRTIFPEKAERLKASLSPSVLSRVVKAETKHEKLQLLRANQLHEEEEKMHIMPTPVTRSASDEDLDNIMSRSTPSARKPEREDNAVTSIQALIRGNMARRFSSRFSMLEENADSSNNEYADEMVPSSHGNSELNLPLYLQQSSTPPMASPHTSQTSTWFEADQISPLTMDNGHGRNSHENGRSTPPLQRKTMSPTKSPPAPTGNNHKVKAASLSMDGNNREGRDHLCDIKVGMHVMMKDRTPVLHGVVQYVGQTSFASGMWVGIMLDVPLGKNNGVVQGVSYFQCLPLHGLFVRPQQLVIVPPPQTAEPIVQTVDIPGASQIRHTTDSPNTATRRSLNNTIGNASPSRTNAEKLRATLNIAHALKVKISKEMHMLNHQLELVENFELQVQGTEGVNQEDCSHFVSSLGTSMYEEELMCKEFRALIHGQQQQM